MLCVDVTLADSCQSANTAALWCSAWLITVKIVARVAAGCLLSLGSLSSSAFHAQPDGTAGVSRRSKAS